MSWRAGSRASCCQCSILLKKCLSYMRLLYNIIRNKSSLCDTWNFKQQEVSEVLFLLDFFVSVLSDALKMLFKIRPYSIWCYFCSFCSFEYFSDKFACLITLKFQLLAFTIWIFELGNIADKAGILKISCLHCKTLSQYSLDLLFTVNEADLIKRVACPHVTKGGFWPIVQLQAALQYLMNSTY